MCMPFAARYINSCLTVIYGQQGLSCRLPESSRASAFWQNLAKHRDMVTSNDLRWPVGLHGTPPRSGKVLDYEKFDAPFFSVHGKQAQVSLASAIELLH